MRLVELCAFPLWQRSRAWFRRPQPKAQQ